MGDGFDFGSVTPVVEPRYFGPVAVLGGGRTVWQDYDRAVSFGIDKFIVTNDIGSHFHGVIEHWVTLHPLYMKGWRYYRDKHTYGAGTPYRTHSVKHEAGIDHVWNTKAVSMSGTFAVWVALALGYSKVLLCGVPMDDSGHYFDHPRYITSNDNRTQRVEWENAKANWFQDRVRSFSGNTALWVGEPSMEWLKS